jgi:hypothetical protein
MTDDRARLRDARFAGELTPLMLAGDTRGRDPAIQLT